MKPCFSHKSVKCLAAAAVLLLATPVFAIGTYTEAVDASKPGGQLKLPIFNTPSSGSYAITLQASSTNQPLQAGTVLTLAKAIKPQKSTKPVVPAQYDPITKYLFIPALAVKKNNVVTFMDVTIEANTVDANGLPQTMTVLSAVPTDTQAGPIGAVGPQGPQGATGSAGSTGVTRRNRRARPTGFNGRDRCNRAARRDGTTGGDWRHRIARANRSCKS